MRVGRLFTWGSYDHVFYCATRINGEYLMSAQIKLTKRLFILALMCIGFIPSANSYGNLFNPNEYYRLTTQWQGDGKSLDVVNNGINNQLQLANTGNFSGQMWKIIIARQWLLPTDHKVARRWKVTRRCK